MATITTQSLPDVTAPIELWRTVASAARTWLDEQGANIGDTVLLVPFVELLAPARRAFADAGVWLPRIHTTRSLAAALGPPRVRQAGEVTGDAAIDIASARRLLAGQGWADAWARRDRRAFDTALQRLVRTAQTLHTWAAALEPSARAVWWTRARQATLVAEGPGATDRLLLRCAVEWAVLGDGADSDRLFAHRPAAWITLQLGGEDALAHHLLQHAVSIGVPALQLAADPPVNDPFDGLKEQCELTVEHAPDAESEAMATAWRAACLLRDGAKPLVLIAQDRELVRRVRALLERLDISVADETGWSLATTRAGARVSAALRAARPHASADDALDWLKADLHEDRLGDVATLEKLWRGQRVSDAQRAHAQAVWQEERARLAAFAQPRRRPLQQWLLTLDALLFDGVGAARWADDAAAMQLRRALRLEPRRGAHHTAWAAASSLMQSLDEFAAWVDAALETHTFVPPPIGSAPQVVITPLSRAIGRDFAAALLPGADAQRLGTLAHDNTFLDESLRRTLGIADRRARQRRAELAFVHLLRLPRVVALRRHADADELLPPSPWLDRLRVARQRRGAAPPTETPAVLPLRLVQSAPVPRPAPSAVGALPPSLSASAVEALRQCPYRFFSRVVLQLSEHDELDDDADKREAGRWLHATLERFHRERGASRLRDQDVAALAATARVVLAEQAEAGGASEEALAPYIAGLAGLSQRYVAWLHQQEAQGWVFDAAEVQASTAPGDASTVRLHGRIDRVDVLRGGDAVRLIDYKTSPLDSLKRKVAQPLEDTQLAVYAALQLERSPDVGHVEAVYVALDDPRAVSSVAHADVTHTARELRAAIGGERLRIEAGEPLPALGEGPVCETCEARGLCRRDHWSDDDGGAAA